MQAYASGTQTVDDTGFEVPLATSAPAGFGFCIIRWRVLDAGAAVALSPPGLIAAYAKGAEAASASGETATAGAFKVTGGNPTLICDTGASASVAWVLYALTDEQP